MYHSNNGAPVPVPLLRGGITWYTDKNVKFRNPKTDGSTLAQVFNGKLSQTQVLSKSALQCFRCDSRCLPRVCCTGTGKPPYWQKPVYELDPRDPTNNGFINEDLIVWMREAAFPNFKKLYGVLNRANPPFTNGLPKGNYSIDIQYSILHCCALHGNFGGGLK